jgi:hypothetical protein
VLESSGKLKVRGNAVSRVESVVGREEEFGKSRRGKSVNVESRNIPGLNK